jgi:hypothetical protein
MIYYIYAFRYFTKYRTEYKQRAKNFLAAETMEKERDNVSCEGGGSPWAANVQKPWQSPLPYPPASPIN